MVRTKGMVRNVFLLGILLALLLTAVWLLLRGSGWQPKPLFDSAVSLSVPSVNPQNSEQSTTGDEAEGVLEIFSPELVFANGAWQAGEDSFELEASGFNLSLLGNPDLRVENTYPMFDLRLAGSLSRENEELRLEVEQITPVFRVRRSGEFLPVDAATQDELLRELSASGVLIPEVSPEQPYVFVLAQTRTEPLQLRAVENTSARFVFVEN